MRKLKLIALLFLGGTVVVSQNAALASTLLPAAATSCTCRCRLRSERSAATCGPRSSFSCAAAHLNCRPLPTVPAAIVGPDCQAVVVSVNRGTKACNSAQSII